MRCSHCKAEHHKPDGSPFVISRICPFKGCMMWFCPSCQHYIGGWGQIMCPCDTSPNGHTTYAEHARPHVRVKRSSRRERAKTRG